MMDRIDLSIVKYNVGYFAHVEWKDVTVLEKPVQNALNPLFHFAVRTVNVEQYTELEYFRELNSNNGLTLQKKKSQQVKENIADISKYNPTISSHIYLL